MPEGSAALAPTPVASGYLRAEEMVGQLEARFEPLRQLAWRTIEIDGIADELEAAGLLGHFSGDEEIDVLHPTLARSLVEFGKDLYRVRCQLADAAQGPMNVGGIGVPR